MGRLFGLPIFSFTQSTQSNVIHDVDNFKTVCVIVLTPKKADFTLKITEL